MKWQHFRVHDWKKNVIPRFTARNANYFNLNMPVFDKTPIMYYFKNIVKPLNFVKRLDRQN